MANQEDKHIDKEQGESDSQKKNGSTTTTTTTVVTKTWLLGLPSVNEDVTVKEYEDTENIREKFEKLTKSTDALLNELHNLKVKNCMVENSKKHRVIANNSRIPYEYSKEVLTPRLTYSRRTVNLNPFIDSADSMPSESHSWIPDSPLEGTQSFLSPQLTRKTQTLPVRQRSKQYSSVVLLFLCGRGRQQKNIALLVMKVLRHRCQREEKDDVLLCDKP